MPHSLANVSSKLQDLLLPTPCKRQAEESHKVLSSETTRHRISNNNDQDYLGEPGSFPKKTYTHTPQLLKSNILQFSVLQDLKTHKEAGMVNSTLLKLCVLGQTLRRALARQLYLKLHSPPPPCHCTVPLYFLHNTFQGGYPAFLLLTGFPHERYIRGEHG